MASISLYVDGDLVTHTGATVPEIVTRVWGEGAELHKNPGTHGTVQIIHRATRRVKDWTVLAQVEQVEYSTPPADLDALMRAQVTVEQMRADLQDAQDERDEAVRSLWERGETMYAIAQAMGVTERTVSQIVAKAAARTDLQRVKADG